MTDRIRGIPDLLNSIDETMSCSVHEQYVEPDPEG